MGIGSGKGKTILFGEHFVVYGLPALAAGISSETVAKVTRKKDAGWVLKDNRPAVPGYKEEKSKEQNISIENILRYCSIDTTKQGFEIELGGNLVCASGIGASAASSVAIARALNDECSLGLNDEQINQAAYEGEKGYHGTPSGIDNTASTYGGLVWFTRDLKGGPPKFETIKLRVPVHLVIASTGITASTKEVVGDVKKKKEEDPAWFEKLSDEYKQIVHEGKDALVRNDLRQVGKRMNRNHELLREMTVSCKELDTLVEIAKRNGAIGAKMTGTGRGGNMIALAPDEATMERVARFLEKAKTAGVWTTTFGL
jgi:mevalonate kinase